MRDSLGGLVNLVIITIFIVIVLGYLAYNINYTKAFRVRDKSIALLNKYEGKCFSKNSFCTDELKNYADQIGYVPLNNVDCSNIDPEYKGLKYAGAGQNNYFCYKKVKVKDTSKKDDKESSYKEGKCRYYYKIFTVIYFDIPVIREIMKITRQYFVVKGNTKIITIDCVE